MFAAVLFVLCASLGFLDMSESTWISVDRSRPRVKKPEILNPSLTNNVVRERVGKSVRLKCEVLNWQSGWKMSWYVNDKILRKRKRFRIRIGKSSLLRIRNVRKEDSGIYKCVASNKYGSASRELNLTVVVEEPEFIDKSPAYLVVEVGKTVRLGCDLFFWEPSWKMTWYLNDKIFRATAKSRFRIKNGKSSFMRIKNVQTEDSGIYKCVASNEYGGASRELNLTVAAGGSPRFTLSKRSHQFIAWPASSDLKLRCAADGTRPLKYQWLKDGKVLKYRRLDPKLDGSKWFLRLRTVVPSDNGLYTCIVSNPLGNISKSFRLKILERQRLRPILSTRFPVNKTATIGESVTFECMELYSSTLSDFRWIRWNKRPPEYLDLKFDENSAYSKNSSWSFTLLDPKQYMPSRIQFSDGMVGYGNKVILNNVTKDDEGMYTCLVSNHVGKSLRSASLHVVSSESTPLFTEADKMKKSLFEREFNDSGRMACSATVEPKQPGKRNRDGERRQFTITLKSVKPIDTGAFTCNVSSQHQSISMTYEFSEREMNGPILGDFENVTADEGDNVTLICKAYNTKKPKLIWFAFDYAQKQYKMIVQGKRFELKAVRSSKEGWQGEGLRLLNVTSGDSKQYVCLGINVVLSRSQSVFVKVLPKKLHPGRFKPV